MKKLIQTVSLLLALATLMICMPQLPIQVKAAGADASTPQTHPNTYVNTGNQRADIIGVALTQVGYTELNHSNNTKYGAALNINYLGWCGAFVSWCAIQAEIPNSIFPKTGVSAPYAFGFEEKYYPAYIPQPGDLFFAKDNSHVGLVYTVNVKEGYFMSLEGNVTYNTYEGVHIEKHSLSAEKYCSPNYQNLEGVDAAGVCGANGNNLNWVLDDEGTLTISGSGAMMDYTFDSSAPWSSRSESIQKVVIENGVTTIGEYAFHNCAKLTTVEIANTVTDIKAVAFLGCEVLTNVTIPASVKSIGISAFQWCPSLNKICFEGSAPTIGEYAFYSQAVTAYYYPDDSWTTSAKLQYGGTVTWVPLSDCKHDFTDWMDLVLESITDKIRVCRKCGFLDTNLTGDIIGEHTWKVESKKSPTCTEAGHEERVLCSDCTLSAGGEEIPALGHDAAYSNITADTHTLSCRREGCNYAGDVASHEFTWQTITAPTCGTAGEKLGICVCGHTKTGEVPALEHDFTGPWKSDDSAHWHACTQTGCNEKKDYALHTLGTHYVITEETEQDGQVLYSHCIAAACTECGYVWQSAMKYTHAHENVETIPSVQPTCTEPGKSTGLVCKECNEVLMAQVELPATGHNYVSGVCSACNQKTAVGDLDGDDHVTDSDVIYLLWHTVFPTDYPLHGNADFNKDGSVTDADVIYLLWHTVFPGDYPLT